MPSSQPRPRPAIAPAILVLVALGVSLPAPGRAQTSLPAGAAVACDGPSPSPLAAATCADPAARGADRRRADVVEILRHQLHPAQRAGLDADATGFDAYLAHACPGPRPEPSCVARAHEAKRADLRRWLLPEAAEEADRDPAAAAALVPGLTARAVPPGPPEARRAAIAARQREAGLPTHGFLDSRTAAALAPPAEEERVWLPAVPPVLHGRYARAGCAAPTLSWFGDRLLLDGRPVAGEARYETYVTEGPAGARLHLVPPGGGARVVELLNEGRIRLTGVIPGAVAARGITAATPLLPCRPR